MRSFSTDGPVVAADHYCIPPLDRIDLASVLKLVRENKYFVLHGPRQAGKTSALLALADLLNSGSHGEYRCLYINVEAARAARESVLRVVRAVIYELEKAVSRYLEDDSLKAHCAEVLAQGRPDTALERLLAAWARSDSRPLVLLIDEIDSLKGDGLLTVLRQLCAGFDRRPGEFPQSIVLCSLRDLPDYRIRSGSTGYVVAGDSAFNISAETLKLGNFSRAEVNELLAQHTAESGQGFEAAAIDRVWIQTRGQPWLVNGLCKRARFPKRSGRPMGYSITEDDIWEAQEDLIQQRGVHLRQLANELEDGRVRRVIEPILTGTPVPHDPTQDIGYARDLGLVAPDGPQRLANPIYREAVPRYLTSAVQAGLPIQPERFIDAEGGLDLHKLLEDFRDFCRQHPELWEKQFLGYEVGAELLLQAYLQKAIDGRGQMLREYGLGRGRTDLLVVWPQGDRKRRFVVECMGWRENLEGLIRVGAVKTSSYMNRNAAEAGHLVILDPTLEVWKAKMFRRRVRVGQSKVEVWGI